MPASRVIILYKFLRSCFHCFASPNRRPLPQVKSSDGKTTRKGKGGYETVSMAFSSQYGGLVTFPKLPSADLLSMPKRSSCRSMLAPVVS